MKNFTQTIKGNFETPEYVFFWGGPFSNWYPSQFFTRIGDSEYSVNCAEQAMMLLKAYIFNDMDTFAKIHKSTDPKIQKKLGRSVVNFSDSIWASCRENLAVQFLCDKFRANPALKTILLNTGNKIIVEASPYDAIWGIKMGVDHPDILDSAKWQGDNLLGKCLMKVREILLQEQSAFDIVKRIGESIHDNRTYNDISNHLVQEVGELSTEISIVNGRSYKTPGDDGIIGESIDIIICALDLIYKADPNITDDQIKAILNKKCIKWLQTSI